MHRYKLSPRGKLYLKTDAEGKQKQILMLNRTPKIKTRIHVSLLQIAQKFTLFSFTFHSLLPVFGNILSIFVTKFFYFVTPMGACKTVRCARPPSLSFELNLFLLRCSVFLLSIVAREDKIIISARNCCFIASSSRDEIVQFRSTLSRFQASN